MRRLVAFALIVVLAGCMTKPAPVPTTPAVPEPFRGFLGEAGGLDSTPLAAPVNFVTNPLGKAANELVIAVNPKDPLNLIAGGKDYRLGKDHPCNAAGDGPTYPVNVWTGVYWSKDGGRTWTDALMPGHPEDSANANHPNRVWPCNSDPVVVFGDDGKAYFSGLGIRGPSQPDPMHPCVERNRSVWLMTSADGGETWGDFECVGASTAVAAPAQSVPAGIIDKQWFAVDGPHIYFVYMEFNPTGVLPAGPVGGTADLLFRASHDGGRTWEPERVLFELSDAEFDAYLEGRQFATPVIGPDGTVYVTWLNFGPESFVYFTKSTDRGATFAPATPVAPVTALPADLGPYRTGAYPILAVDAGAGPQSGNLYLVWATNDGGNVDVLFARSTDGGDTWARETTAGVFRPLDLPGAVDGQQFMPWITVAPDGTIHVVFLDSTGYESTKRLDLRHAVSMDGGDLWSPPFRVNAATIETEGCIHQNGGPFIGDYLGVAASDLAAHPLWPDGRNGMCQAMTATLLRGA